MVSYAYREEKGTDVNVAAHLLTDVLTNEVDAAIVVSNDSDLALPITAARSTSRLESSIRREHDRRRAARQAVRRRGPPLVWWYQLTDQDCRGNQMPDPAGGVARPAGW